MRFPSLSAALISVVCVLALLSSWTTPHAIIGEASVIQLTPDSYRVSFYPTGDVSWDLAYGSALLCCAGLTIENGYRYFGVTAIENYSSATSFTLHGKSKSHGFYDADSAYNPPHGPNINYRPQPALTIKMLRDPIPGV